MRVMPFTLCRHDDAFMMLIYAVYADAAMLMPRFDAYFATMLSLDAHFLLYLIFLLTRHASHAFSRHCLRLRC